jgi:phage terminase large subunit-like protein
LASKYGLKEIKVDINKLSTEEKLQYLNLIEKEEKELSSLFDETKDLDPFWWYKPATGYLDPKGVEFIKKWLQVSDIPDRFQGMLETFTCDKRIISTFGGNQVGKTTASAIKSHIKIIGKLPYSLNGKYPEWKLPKKWPVYGRVYGLSNDVIEEVIVPKFKEWMPRTYMKNGVWENSYSKQEKILRYYEGGKKFIGQIKFLSCEKDVSKSQGASLSFAHFDEEPPKEFYDECLPRFIANHGKGIDIEFFMTPTNGITWAYNTLFKSSNRPDSDLASFKVATVTNPYANLETLEQMMKDADKYEERLMRILGEFISLGGLIYSGDSAIDPKVHVIPPFTITYNRYLVLRGLDPHLSKPTACVEVVVDREGFVYVIGAYKKQSDIDKVKQDLAERALKKRYRLGWTSYDKSLDYDIKALGDLNIIDRYKLPPNPIPSMIPSEKFEGSIKAGIDAIKQYLKKDQYTGKPKLYFFNTPEVWDLIDDMQTLERDRGRNESQRGQRDKINEGPKDLHAALRYIFQKPLIWSPSDAYTDGVINVNSDEERYI